MQMLCRGKNPSDCTIKAHKANEGFPVKRESLSLPIVLQCQISWKALPCKPECLKNKECAWVYPEGFQRMAQTLGCWTTDHKNQGMGYWSTRHRDEQKGCHSQAISTIHLLKYLLPVHVGRERGVTGICKPQDLEFNPEMGKPSGWKGQRSFRNVLEALQSLYCH